MTFKLLLISLLALVATACDAQDKPTTPNRAESRYVPTISSTWHWQLQGKINPNLPVDIYDIDLLDSPHSLIKTLHQNGKKVICYFSAGSLEDWRDDATAFDKATLGKPLGGWKGEYWLDVRSESIKPIMLARLDIAKDKNCDGVEPDNVDAYANNSGFALTANDQLSYNKWLAKEAHARGLSVGLKNDLGQVEELVEHFDFAVNEQCFEHKECGRLKAFTQSGKAVFSAEYDRKYFDDKQAKSELCKEAQQLKLSTLILPEKLDGSSQLRCI